MNLGGRTAQVAVGAAELPRTLENSYVVPTHDASAKDTSVTAHCHAATALLTREYQGDYRRFVPTPASTCAALPNPLTNPLTTLFHIRSSAEKWYPTTLQRPNSVQWTGLEGRSWRARYFPAAPLGRGPSSRSNSGHRFRRFRRFS
jgi:hypothetical protein